MVIIFPNIHPITPLIRTVTKHLATYSPTFASHYFLSSLSAVPLFHCSTIFYIMTRDQPLFPRFITLYHTIGPLFYRPTVPPHCIIPLDHCCTVLPHYMIPLGHCSTTIYHTTPTTTTFYYNNIRQVQIEMHAHPKVAKLPSATLLRFNFILY